MSEITPDVEMNASLKEFMENTLNPVPLHPELEPFVVQADPDSNLSWDMLKNPLVFGIPYMPTMNYYYNQQYEAKTKAVSDAIAREDWSRYIYMHERPHRFDALETIMSFNELSGQAYWELMARVWSDSENIWQVGYKRLRRLLALHPGHRDSFMEDYEKKFFQCLPDRFKVFRGHQRQNQKGFSWTLSFVTARWFGQRFERPGHGKVSHGVVQKSDIIGLILGRNEMEVVVDPRHVKDIKVMKMVPRSEPFEELRQKMISQFRLHGRTDHGPDHWDKVDWNAVELCKRIPEADPTVARLFAIFHDSQRQNEMDDPEHGPRAADLTTKMYRDGKLLGITEDQFKKLEYACRHHNGGKPVTDPTIAVCWDADRLDLLRVGIIPDPKLLSTEVAKNLICLI